MKAYFNAWNYVFEGLPKPFWKLFKYFPDLDYAWEKAPINDMEKIGLNYEYIERYKYLRSKIDPFQELNKTEKSGIKIITIRDDEYPSQLRSLNTHLPPVVLYVKGAIPINRFEISIVGTRQNTGYGESVTKKIINGLKPYNIVVVSGMAQGIDSIAHAIALENNMPTVAVLGFGLNMVPYHKKQFVEKIIKTGAVISEYPPGMPAEKFHFPLRNRIISGLSKAVIVVEAGEKSGALITADYALNQSREVFAVPGSLDNEKSIGTNQLIQNGGAHLLIKPEDILEVFGIEKKENEYEDGLNEKQKKIVKQIKKSACSKDDLMQLSLFSPQDLNTTLTELELEGVISKNRNGIYFIN